VGRFARRGLEGRDIEDRMAMLLYLCSRVGSKTTGVPRAFQDGVIKKGSSANLRDSKLSNQKLEAAYGA